MAKDSKKQSRTVGVVTGATTAGGGLGAAIAQILIEFFPRLENVEAAVTVVLTVALALVAGYLVPNRDREKVQQILEQTSFPTDWGGDSEHDQRVELDPDDAE